MGTFNRFEGVGMTTPRKVVFYGVLTTPVKTPLLRRQKFSFEPIPLAIGDLTSALSALDVPDEDKETYTAFGVFGTSTEAYWTHKKKNPSEHHQNDLMAIRQAVEEKRVMIQLSSVCLSFTVSSKQEEDSLLKELSRPAVQLVCASLFSRHT